jgi:hypothetical protein
VYGSSRSVRGRRGIVGSTLARRPETTGQGEMADTRGSTSPGDGETTRETAGRIADQIAPIRQAARAKGFDS